MLWLDGLGRQCATQSKRTRNGVVEHVTTNGRLATQECLSFTAPPQRHTRRYPWTSFRKTPTNGASPAVWCVRIQKAKESRRINLNVHSPCAAGIDQTPVGTFRLVVLCMSSRLLVTGALFRFVYVLLMRVISFPTFFWTHAPH